MKNLVAFGVTFILLSTVFIPSISANLKNISENEEIVEIPVELFGLGEINSHNVTLTIADAIKLHSYLDSIEDKLANSTSKKETISIFNEVIDELVNFSLLDDFNIKEIKKIVTGSYLKTDNMNLLKNLFEGNETDYNNMLCLICGLTSKTMSFGLVENSILYSLQLLALAFAMLLPIEFVAIPFYMLVFLIQFIYFYIIPVRMLGSINIGTAYYDFDDEKLKPVDSANGWVFTLGLLGTKMCKETKWGQLELIKNYEVPFSRVYLPGARGFTGLIIRLFGDNFYIGNTLIVDVGPDFPY